MICISFNMHNILHKRYYNVGLTDKYLVQTQSQTKSSAIKLPEIYDIKEILDKNSLPENRKKTLKLKRVLKLNQD